MTGYELNDRSLIPDRFVANVCRRRIQTESGVHSASYPMGSEVKAARA